MFLSVLVIETAHKHTKTEHLPKTLPKIIYLVQFNHIKCLVPNCPGAKLSGAKLSWCQIVLVPNCPLLLSWCQIVRFYYLGAKLSALLSWCQIVRCQIVWCQIVPCQIVMCQIVQSNHHPQKKNSLSNI